MMRLVTSSFFVASNLVASFFIVIILVRNAETEARAAFFLFQTVFFPMVALMSQTRIQQVLRGEDQGSSERLVDLGAFALSALLLFLLGQGRFTPVDVFCFALSVPVTYRTATNLAMIQKHAFGPLVILWPIGSAAFRLLACFLVPTAQLSIIFVVAALAGLAFSLLGRTMISAQSKEASGALDREQTFYATLMFFAVSSFAFQWDRMVMAQLGLDGLIIASGVCFAWVLSPVSALFATIYRARAGDIFSDEDRQKKQRAYMRNTKLFVLACLAFCAVVALTWRPINQIAFPFNESPFYLPIILILAVMLDRIGNLRLFTFAKDGSMYRWVAFTKVLTILCGVGAVLFFASNISLMVVYLVYLSVSAVYCALIWRLV